MLMVSNLSINTDASDKAACAGYIYRWAQVDRRDGTSSLTHQVAKLAQIYPRMEVAWNTED